MITGDDAVISACGRYRYLLSRRVDRFSDKGCLFIMLNPSTANATTDDPTIRRCIGFARFWGCGQLYVANLFAWRATKPSDLRGAFDPVGPENYDYLTSAADFVAHGYPMNPENHGPIVCAWGAHGTWMNQDSTVLGWLDNVSCDVSCLGLTKDGHPRHPLYLKKDLRPLPLPKTSEGIKDKTAG